MMYHQQREGVKGLYMHDPLAIGYLLQPDLFDVVDAYVQVETQDDFTRGRTYRQSPRETHRFCSERSRVCRGGC